MFESSIGEIAALATACCWVVTSIAFAQAGGRIGSFSVNLIRLVLAFPMLCVTTYLIRGMALPTDASLSQWGWLSLSGIVGFVFGDMCLFQAFVLIGPRLSSLIMSTAPLMTALIGYWILGEGLGWLAAIGMFLTIAGVLWAVLDSTKVTEKGREKRSLGIVLALGGALGQAAGLVLSKHGMGEYDAFAATQIRVLASLLGWFGVFFVTRRFSQIKRALADRIAMKATTFGAFFGPVVGVGLSLFAVQHANTGVAASIMSTTPVLLIPISIYMFKEKVGWGGIVGSLLAVAGVAVLFAL